MDGMKKAEGIFSALIALLCLGYLYFVQQMDDFGSVTEPGAAFFPGVLGALGLVVSLKVLYSALRTETASKKGAIPRDGLLRFFAYVVVSLIFIPVFETLGAYIAIFALVLILSKILGSKGWLQPFSLAAASAVIAYGLFYIALEVPLPRGIFF